jgi:carbon monoxide dehydrogenase subunit G
VNFSTETRIKASPERVFSAITDLDSWRHWMPNFVSVEKLTDGAVGVGTEWKETRKMFGKAASEVFEVTAFDPPTRLGLRVDGSKGSTGKGEFLFDYELLSDQGGTLMQMTGEINIPGLMAKVMGKLFFGAFQKAIDKDHAALKDYVEKGAT